MKTFLLHLAGTVYEASIGQSFVQRLIRRKIQNSFRRVEGKPPLSSWEDSRCAYNGSSKPTEEECHRLNEEALRSV